MGHIGTWAVAAAVVCMALMASLSAESSSLFDFNSEQALVDLTAGGERVCSYCKYCNLGNLCGRFCVLDLCDFCRFQYHCNTTCLDEICKQL